MELPENWPETIPRPFLAWGMALGSLIEPFDRAAIAAAETADAFRALAALLDDQGAADGSDSSDDNRPPT